ncbi:hypothetical protein D9611_010738 [Ephemerocybe angulata]|uniref:DUF6533 domain-containing protein n=1 Tax=Ephemerocybe angulata TaxID=980116 RepID=A0A8H5BC07_9AGAR|nr:hypothetical protein D9611_010738 [Tulosesus angulatus]
MASTDLAATYAALILADDGIEITADKINALTSAANVDIEPIWASLLAKALEGKNVKDLLSNVGAGGGAPAAGGVPAAAAGGAAEDAPKAEEKVEEKEESDDDMVRLLRLPTGTGELAGEATRDASRRTLSMDATPEEIAEMTSLVSVWTKQDVSPLLFLSTPDDLPIVHIQKYISLAFYSFYGYYYLTTLAEEVAIIWPQKLRTGKILFLFNRYIPMTVIILSTLLEFRVYTVLDPKVCQGLDRTNAVTWRANAIASEIVLLLCLHALLGSKGRFLVLIMVIYTGLTLGVIIPQLKFYGDSSSAVETEQIDIELGYACSWEGDLSDAARKGSIIAGYVALAKPACIALLAIGVFYARYRRQTGSLIKVLRRDSGVYVFAMTIIRLANAIVITFSMKLGYYNLFDVVMNAILICIGPILACRLLLNMQETVDEGVRTIITTLLFDPSNPTNESEDNIDSSNRPVEMKRYKGLGRKKDTEKAEPEGAVIEVVERA